MGSRKMKNTKASFFFNFPEKDFIRFGLPENVMYAAPTRLQMRIDLAFVVFMVTGRKIRPA